MEHTLYALSHNVEAIDIRDVRRKMQVTQDEFAKILGCSRPTVERWERSDDKITGPIAVLVNLILEHPEYVESLVIPKKTYPLRLSYMYKDRICTIIDVDESRCFPRERDKMKLVLKELNLPFYDPLMIIEKTEGRMAEDAFWIKVER